MYNLVMAGEAIPQWGTVMLVLLHKKGRKDLAENYRGIAIESILEKIFSLAWSARLTPWFEENGLLDGSQFGFRPKRSTLDAVFVAETLLWRARTQKRPLILIFVDFSKAFDTVPRARLWSKLRAMGAPEEVIGVFEWVYGKVWGTLRGEDGEKSDYIKFLEGVKQGDPLSTLFFGAFINDITAFLRLNGAIGTNIGSGDDLVNLVALLFADGTTLVAETVEDAQRQLDLLSHYASLNRIEVNVGKTEWMGINVPGNAGLRYRDGFLNCVETFPLLGYYLTATGSRDAQRMGQEAKANVAHGTWKRFKGKCRIRDVETILSRQPGGTTGHVDQRVPGTRSVSQPLRKPIQPRQTDRHQGRRGRRAT
jgi:hypothetical protein